MNLLLAIPMPPRLALLFVLGTLAGAIINWGVYRLAYNARAIGPWTKPLAQAPPRIWSDRLPVFGWLGLRREAKLHGQGFWLRPLLVELFTGLAFAGLYWLDLAHANLLWVLPGNVAPPFNFLNGDTQAVAHSQYLSHVLLLCLMLTASLIDLDEKTIPDAITVTGTLAALVLAYVLPWSLPPAHHFRINGQPFIEFLTLASPNAWPSGLDGLPTLRGLGIALACWTLWCGGLLPRYWNTRRGLHTAARVLFHRLLRERISYLIAGLWLIGGASIVAAAAAAPQAHWAALVSALVGVAAGGGLIWLVRVIGTAVLDREAMGFGDVTLVAMIGAFLGWQSCLIVFFVAPFMGLALAIANWIAHGEHEIPYGPFLCLAALAVIVKWGAFWDRAYDIFSLGWVVPALMGVCLVLLGVLLGVYRYVSERMLARE